jgi:hypothetical protein
MTTLLLMTALWWAILFAVTAGLRRFLGNRWRRVAALTVIPAALIATALELFNPPLGTYDPLVARYWMSRAAAEHDSASKEAHVRRVAMTGPDHGWFLASQAIGHVEDRAQRCRLRTILAGLPAVQNQRKLGAEARDECNALLMERKP